MIKKALQICRKSYSWPSKRLCKPDYPPFEDILEKLELSARLHEEEHAEALKG